MNNKQELNKNVNIETIHYPNDEGWHSITFIGFDEKRMRRIYEIKIRYHNEFMGIDFYLSEHIRFNHDDEAKDRVKHIKKSALAGLI